MLAVDKRAAPDPVYTPRKSNSSASHQSKTCSKTALVDTPPTSPPTDRADPIASTSTLFPPHNFQEIAPGVRQISSDSLVEALNTLSTTRLPDSDTVFPWLHGLHATNIAQRSFFDQCFGQIIPPCNYRGIILLPAHSSKLILHSRLAGSIDFWELFKSSGDVLSFLNTDPLYGITLRNFQIQAAKLARLSDIILYDISNGAKNEDVLKLAERVATAQSRYRQSQRNMIPEYNTFVLSESFEMLHKKYPHLVSLDAKSMMSSYEVDFLCLEKEQMRLMTQATEISDNVYLGNLQDWEQKSGHAGEPDASHKSKYSVHIQCNDRGLIPSMREKEILDDQNPEHVLEVSFPSSGCLGDPTVDEIKDFVDFCAWIYGTAHGRSMTGAAEKEELCSRQCSQALSEFESNNAIPTCSPNQLSSFSRKILVTCNDGYTETTLLALGYIIFANCMTVDQAWIHLHKARSRNFYAFPEDVSSLKVIATHLIRASPHPPERKLEALVQTSPVWFEGAVNSMAFSGSFPSRILDHLYLGNLEHANKTDMLKALGISRVLSIGEQPAWMSAAERQDVSVVSKVIELISDDGIDSLMTCLESCLSFIDEGFKGGQITLVHCRVGVSRSASICIAEVIRRLSLSLHEAYLLVRARRLNVIIQPNLRFMYELHKWSQEELSRQQGRLPEQLLPRSLEWHQLSTKIAALNKAFTQPQ